MQSSGCFEISHVRLDDGFTFSCSDELDTIGGTVRAYGLAGYEPPVTSIIIELVKKNPGTILDVGANTGLYTLVAAAASRSANVIAFEPLEPVRKLLASNIELNQELAQRIVIQPLGLSSESGSYKFYETINNRGFVSTSSSLERGHVEQVGGDYVEHTIQTVTLDEFGDTLGDSRVTFMKIDVEGHEHAVISGGRRFISHHRPIITAEVLGSAEVGPINDLLLTDNYLAFAMAPEILRQCEHVEFFSDAWNHLLVPAEGINQVFSLCRRIGLRLELH